MAKAVTRLFDNHDDAARAVRELRAAGVRDDAISLIASNAEGRHLHPVDDDDNDAAEGAAKGAATGGLLGGGAGLLAGLGMLAIPGVGPVVAAGWLVATVAGAAAGAAAGGAAGGILGALKDAGHSDEDAHVYAEGIRRGGDLVSVRTDSETDRAVAERVLLDRGGVDAVQRGEAYRASGWARFDEAASPYSADEVAMERSRYAEDRSFDGREASSDIADGDLTSPAVRPLDPTLRRGV